MKLIIFITAFYHSALFATLTTDIAKFDKLYAQRDNLENVQKAIYGHEELLKKYPNSFELLWRLSMENYFLGHKNIDTDTKIKFHQKGINFAKQCAKVTHHRQVECLFWQATNLALFYEASGVMIIAFKIKELIKLFQQTKKINPLYLGAGPSRILSSLYYKAPYILGGDRDKALEEIHMALKLSPTEPLNYRVLIGQLVDQKKIAEAKNFAQQAIRLIDPKKIKFWESRGAFKDIIHFSKTGKLLP